MFFNDLTKIHSKFSVVIAHFLNFILQCTFLLHNNCAKLRAKNMLVFTTIAMLGFTGNYRVYIIFIRSLQTAQ